MENESTFVAPEGVYSITEELKALPMHFNTINSPPSQHPTRLSTVIVRFPATKQGAPGLAQLLGGGNKDFRRDKDKSGSVAPGVRDNLKDDGISASSSETPEESYSSPDQAGGVVQVQDSIPGTPVILNEPHNVFSPPATGNKKKSIVRPKHNIRTTSSTFITRLQSTEGLTKILQAKQGETTFVFYNAAKSFIWSEMGSKAKEPLTRITFSAFPTCHDVNTATACSDRVDVVIGFSTGDLIWFDPISSRYGRLNKQGSITNSPCTAVRWVPSSSTLFLVSHADGTMIIYDKEREDGVFTAQDPDASGSSATSGPSVLQQGEWNPVDTIFVTMPPWHPVTAGGGIAGGKPDKDKTAKNPVSHWKVSRRGVVDFVFSPDVKYVAAISEDGCLRVIDALAEQLVDCYSSYFGALTCVAWSPDGRFILTGGQDDLITIFSPWEQRVIARCQGHSSFVSSVSFDDIRCDGRTYRFGSVGEDNKLILWDFSSGALHRPKFQATHHQRISMSSTISLAFRRGGSTFHLPALPSPGMDGAMSPLPRYHPAPSRNEVSVVQPVLIKHIESDILTAVSFLPRALLTATKNGHIKIWIRPLVMRYRHIKNRERSYSIDIQGLIQ